MRNFIITIDGKQYQVGVEELESTQNQTPVVSEIKPIISTTTNTQVSANATKITAPMPGMIKNLSVAEGTKVKNGDVILVLEAMKMDNDITSPCDGTISYKVVKGANVDTGALMAVIE